MYNPIGISYRTLDSGKPSVWIRILESNLSQIFLEFLLKWTLKKVWMGCVVEIPVILPCMPEVSSADVAATQKDHFPSSSEKIKVNLSAEIYVSFCNELWKFNGVVISL